VQFFWWLPFLAAALIGYRFVIFVLERERDAWLVIAYAG
jgi:hypothetical protein